MVGVLMVFMLALNAAPARSSEAATADDTARFLAGLPSAWKPKRRGRQAAELRESSRSVGRSKLAGVRQNENIVAVEADLVRWGNGVRYGRGTNAARLLQAGHNCAAGY